MAPRVYQPRHSLYKLIPCVVQSNALSGRKSKLKWFLLVFCLVSPQLPTLLNTLQTSLLVVYEPQMDLVWTINNLSYSINCTCTQQLCTYCFCSLSQTAYALCRVWNLQRPLTFKRPKPALSLTAVRFCSQCNIFYNHFLPIAKQDQTLETVCRKGLFCFHPWMCVQPMLQCLAV